jgi:GntR family transcriptional regulator, transcriptional repressor for pyruvate dehydrogenase complex
VHYCHCAQQLKLDKQRFDALNTQNQEQPSHEKESDVMAADESKFAPVESTPVYIKVAEAIEEEIVSGRIQPGERIGTEADLCTAFGVNRSTVREGIRQLEQSGMIRRDKSRQLVASIPRYDNLATRVSRALILHKTTFQEVWEASLTLEPAIAANAAELANEEEIALITRNIEESSAAIGDPEQVSKLDSEFHSLVAKAGKNRVLQLAREPVALLFDPSLKIIMEHIDVSAQRNHDAHVQIFQAIRDRDPEKARSWCAKHIMDWRRGYQQTGRNLNDPIGQSVVAGMTQGNAYKG